MMWHDKPGQVESERYSLSVLVHAPFGKDGDLIGRVLEKEGIAACRCHNLDELFARLPASPGAVIIADEALNKHVVEEFTNHLGGQPAWSDLPVMVMTSGGDANEGSIYRLKLLEPLGNVTLLERPLRKVTLVSAVRTALRARSRQYDIRDYLTEKKHAEEELRQSEERWRFLANALPQFIWVTGSDRRVEFINDYWYDYTGLSRDLPAGWSQAVHPDDLDLVNHVVPEDGANASERTFEYRVRRASDADWRWHLGLIKPELGAAGRLARWIGAGIEIHERRETEAALRRANTALEQFAYAAAHDLQEPARTIVVYSQLVAARLKDKLDEPTTQYLHFTIEAARRMQSLIHDLFSYTRAVDDQNAADIKCDAQEVLQGVLQNLQLAISEAGAEIISGPLPPLAVSEAHLIQLFQNLVSNALKYRSERPPRIEISTQQREDEWIFAVKDNGQGIAPEHYNKIFLVFKRLHGREIPGTGIGLAICERVVSHYGGKIWLESKEGEGTTFYFSLPAARAEMAAGKST